ncbi:M13 family metallopeptidase [Longimicrobium sp.]|uniref:M13 family metallopeptidase n=1 Tax=Longimicrobium sp. TaxID=2029185 RepID=UPI002B5740CF|nr:M13 family metallopeptidase [Longimicrobium sp.]HSU15292.1 M13 family metallopeptidase [Longimicrobium sp.]
MTLGTTLPRAWLRGAALGVAFTAAAAAQLGAQVKELGVDTAGFDRSVRPQDDFYQFVNGNWARTAQIPADRGSFGAFVSLTDRSEAAVHQILDQAVAANGARGSDTQKLGDLYASFMDSARVEQLGITPIRPDLARIRAVNSAAQYPALFAAAAKTGVGYPFGVGVMQDAKQSDRYTVYVRQGGLGLPDRDYYLSSDARLQQARDAYVTYMETLLRLAGEPDAAGSARRVLAFETQLAQRQWDRVRSRNRDLTYNKMSIADLQKLAPRFGWTQYLGAAGLNTPEVIVSAPSYIAGLDSVLAAAPVADVKAYMLVRLLDNSAEFLSTPFQNAQFQFRGRTLAGLQQQRPRWKRGVGLVQRGLGMMLGRAYVEQNFPAENKAAMERLVQNLMAAFGQGIDSLSWMSPETKAQAHDKLSHITVKIGYPDKWQDYSALQVARGDLVGNLRAIGAYEWNRMTARLGQPVDRTEWGMTPQTVNAYYNSTNNEIVFPAAILQPPFFNPNADDAVNYGGIVAVIGHEVSHAFDDQGRKSDGAGNLRDWWTASDASAFQQRADALSAQYDAYVPLEGMHVNGKLTLGENIGDLSGLAVAYRAYRNSLQGREAPVIGGFTGDQRFFLGWAQVWRTLYRDASLRNQLLTDPHSPGQFRGNGPLVNNAAFYRAFGVKEGDKMYRPEADRVVIW